MINPRPKPPPPGGEYTHFIDTGPQQVSPNATRVNLIPVGDGGPGPPLPRVTRVPPEPFLPTVEEIGRLSKAARVAFAGRCALRVVPLVGGLLPGHDSDDPATVAEVAATAGVAILRARSDPRDLRVIRGDYEGLVEFVEEEDWDADRPIPLDVWSLWPPGRTPRWARVKKPNG